MISYDAHDVFVFKPIIEGLAFVRNLKSQVRNKLRIGFELVFLGRNWFFLELVSVILKEQNIDN
jgi:hypothetical protein